MIKNGSPVDFFLGSSNGNSGKVIYISSTDDALNKKP